jgi:hypothetical protein
LGLDDVVVFEDNREQRKSIPEKQASSKHRDAMGETKNQQVNVKLELQNRNVQGEEREKDEKKKRFSRSAGRGETTINFSKIIKKKEDDICSQGIHHDFP